jgi:soluble lytic murein transglycosylase-like protein
VRVLRPADLGAYAAAFAAVRRGDFDAADAALKKVRDTCLVGRVTYEKLMSPTYTASFAELKAWLQKYHQMPGAERVWSVARKRQIASELPLPDPDPVADGAADAAAWSRVERVAERLEAPPKPKVAVSRAIESAREAYYRGDVALAYRLSRTAGEHWVLGLAAYRLKHFDEARDAFAALSRDRAQNDWVRSAAAYWAARASIAGGHAEAAPAYLRTAAATPYTFYGLIAERQLGLDPAVGPDGLVLADPARGDEPGRIESAPSAPETAIMRMIRTDPRAHRAAAFAQLGLRAEAGLEVRTALLGAPAGAERRRWAAVALAIDAPLSSPTDLGRGRRTFDLSSFQTPDFYPIGGYTLDKALVYALVKQESRFNPDASSTAGAYGLMQLTPTTAARVTQDDGLIRDPSALKDPALNLRIGQDYVSRLLEATKGDLVHAIAAYNSGPGTIIKTAAQMPGADSLLILESTPGGQTREYVQRVVANYWIYRLMLGQTSRTLDAAASAARQIKAVLDQP